MPVVMRLIVLCCVIAVGCIAKQPPRARVATTKSTPPLSCEQANRLAYRTVTVLGYTPTDVQVARPGQPGSIYATKEGAGGGKVTINCGDGGATVVAENTKLGIPSFIGGGERPTEFQNIFSHTFGILAEQREIAEQRGPEKGLTVTMTKLNGFESQIELGADLPASGVLPIKVEITNNTPRPYGFDASRVFLMSDSGGRTTPIAAPAAAQGKALQGEVTIAPGQSVTGFLFYPNGAYSSARTTLVDKENDEGEGFSVQF